MVNAIVYLASQKIMIINNVSHAWHQVVKIVMHQIFVQLVLQKEILFQNLTIMNVNVKRIIFLMIKNNIVSHADRKYLDVQLVLI
jgi:hypothetical protein